MALAPNTALAARVFSAQAPTPPRRSPLLAVTDTEAALVDLRLEVKRRVEGGALIWLDGKKPCDGGPFGDDPSRTRDNPFDPGWCTRDRERVMPPVLRVNVGRDYERLFWPDIYQRALTQINLLLASQPDHREAWSVRLRWTRSMSELVSIALDATNIQPMFFFAAPWAQVAPRKAPCTATGSQPDPGCPGDGAVIEWGDWYACFTLDGQQTMPTEANGATKLVRGRSIPIEVWRHSIATMQQVARARSIELADWGGLPYVPEPARMAMLRGPENVLPDFSMWRGPHTSREGAWIEPVGATIAPAMMAGSCIVQSTQLARSLAQGEHDPWTWRRGVIGHDEVLAWYDRAAVDSRSAAERVFERQITEGSVARPFEVLFRLTQGRPSGVDTAFRVPGRSGVHGDENDATWFPNSQWFVEHAAAWGRALVDRPPGQLTVDATLFYITNHIFYYHRRYGEASGFPIEDLNVIADGMRRDKVRALQAFTSAGASFLRPLAGPLVTGIVAGLAAGIQEEMSRVLHFPELPKSLFRRIPIDVTGGAEGMMREILGGGSPAGQAAERWIASLANLRPRSRWKPYAIGGGVALGLGLLWYWARG